MKDFTGLYEIDRNSVTFTEALGISNERAEELSKVLESCKNTNDTISGTFVELWNNVGHPNEFAYVVFEYGVRAGTEKTLQRIFSDWNIGK